MQNLKVLLFDIEATNLSANFGYVLCIAYKWLHEKKVHTISITDFPRFKKDVTNDIDVLKAFEKVFNKADAVIHHYGDKFDIPFLQTRRLIHGLKVLPAVSSIDTWKIVKYKLKLTNNRLATLIKSLGTPTQKTPLTGPIWTRAAAGHKASINYVKKHCIADAKSLEEIYLKIAPLMGNHPKIGRPGYCPVCDHGVVRSLGKRITNKTIYRRYVCCKCGHAFKGEKL
jgi:DNA polymerase elongation subunit (family B)